MINNFQPTGKELLVIGGASLDILHFSGQTAASAGGSGMYTASAAQRVGGQVAMFAPRPNPIPPALQPFADRVEWLGPEVSPEQLPRFEISQEGEQTTYLNFFNGAEADLVPELLPADLSGYGCVHIGPLGQSARQLAFLRAGRARGASRISVSTFPRAALEEVDTVRRLIAEADLFFMNESEARQVFGSLEQAKTRPGKVLFVTLGPRGARVIQGDYPTDIPAPVVAALDVTGAGDTFSGATLIGLVWAEHPVVAARKAVHLAAEAIQQVGPSALWQTVGPLAEPGDPRVQLNPAQIERVAQVVARLPEVRPFDYTDPNFPPAGHAVLLDFLFSSTLQQFSFWEAQAGRYHRPLLAPLAGAIRKGSEYLWQAYLRPMRTDPAWYSPARQAALTHADMLALFRADDGSDPMPALELHLAQAQAYGRDMVALGLTPLELVDRANQSERPLATFLTSLDHIGGYKEDPLRKKSTLLAIILAERPEKFLRPAAAEVVPPIIDYHLQRSCLRIGLVEVVDQALRQALAERRLLAAADEQAVREACYDAIRQVADRAGKSIAAIDWFFFNARRRCPEMTEPECERCPVDPVCGHHKELFQPVFRTTFY